MTNPHERTHPDYPGVIDRSHPLFEQKYPRLWEGWMMTLARQLKDTE